jgi:hypothetical protein
MTPSWVFWVIVGVPVAYFGWTLYCAWPRRVLR